MSGQLEFSDAEDDEPASRLSPLAKRVHSMGLRAKSEKESQAESAGPDGEARQLDLFVADLLDYSLKDDTATMEAPLFSLSTKPDTSVFKWESPDKKKWLTVTPSMHGRATIHDKDLLIYLTSQLVKRMDEAIREGSKMPGRRVRFTLHDYLMATQRDTSGRAYELFEASLDRLKGTQLKTNIEMGKLNRRTGFGLIETYELVTEGKDSRLTSVEITLSEWLYQALEHKNVLTISDQYFGLRKPLEKRLYEIARKHVGKQAEWTIREDNLFEKTGSRASLREFRRMLKAIIEDDSIPDYRMMATKNAAGENIVKMYQKDSRKLVTAMTKKAK